MFAQELGLGGEVGGDGGGVLAAARPLLDGLVDDDIVAGAARRHLDHASTDTSEVQNRLWREPSRLCLKLRSFRGHASCLFPKSKHA